MEITVNIKCPDLSLAAAALAKALMGSNSPAELSAKYEIDPEAVKAVMQKAPIQDMPAQPPTTSNAPAENPTPVEQNTPSPAPSFSQSPAETTPMSATAAPSSSPAIVPTTPAPQITGDMVAKAGADLIAVNPAAMGPLNALLQKYGVGCAQELRPDQIGPFATEMRALGAKI